MNIVHCDIKPENILINEVFDAYISDFGISKNIDTTNITVLGGYTTAYAAYENFSSDLQQSKEYQETKVLISKKTDVWSFGCLIFSLFTN